MTDDLGALGCWLRAHAPLAIAVSGGVDSMTLAFVAHREIGVDAVMFHADSPAVPAAAGARVRDYAGRLGWDLRIVSAGEFDDEDYRGNPVNRCFYCKTNLYGTLADHSGGATLASGTNLDDLGDFRPGLQAAEDFGVRHPWVEVGARKRAIRTIAAGLGLDDLADLPAAPCLSSRIETGIAIEAAALGLVDRVERMVSRAIGPRTVRCRIRRDGMVIELDAEGLARLRSPDGAALRSQVGRLSAAHGQGSNVRFEPYRMGSAFKHG